MMLRELLDTLSRMRPNVPLVVVKVGNPNVGWFSFTDALPKEELAARRAKPMAPIEPDAVEKLVAEQGFADKRTRKSALRSSAHRRLSVSGFRVLVVPPK